MCIVNAKGGDHLVFESRRLSRQQNIESMQTVQASIDMLINWPLSMQVRKMRWISRHFHGFRLVESVLGYSHVSCLCAYTHTCEICLSFILGCFSSSLASDLCSYPGMWPTNLPTYLAQSTSSPNPGARGAQRS